MAAGLLVLLGLGLFVGGVLTGTTAFYWGCVGACAVAAVLLFLARRRAPAPSEEAGAAKAETEVTSGKAPASTRAAADEPVEATARRRPEEPAPEHVAERGATPEPEQGEPGIEEVEVTDLLLVVDLTDDVLVVDEHPRYHLEGCRHLAGREAIPIPLDEARADGFTPCAACAPDRHLAERARNRRAPRGAD